MAALPRLRPCRRRLGSAQRESRGHTALAGDPLPPPHLPLRSRRLLRLFRPAPDPPHERHAMTALPLTRTPARFWTDAPAFATLSLLVAVTALPLAFALS